MRMRILADEKSYISLHCSKCIQEKIVDSVDKQKINQKFVKCSVKMNKDRVEDAETIIKMDQVTNCMPTLSCKEIVLLQPRKNARTPADHSSDLKKKLYSCVNCGKSYKIKGALNRHLKQKCGQKSTFSCPYCTYSSKSSPHIQKHIRRMHQSKKMRVIKLTHSQTIDKLLKNPPYINNIYERYSCADCSRSYKTKGTLSRHLRYECGTKRFGCPYCDHRSYQAFHMKKHIKNVHPTKLQAVCLTPSRNIDKQLGKHYTPNSYERYNCAHCGIWYKYKKSLVRHLRSDCSKRKSRMKKNLQARHLAKKIHAAKLSNLDPENPSSNVNERYSCADCGKSYKRRASLIRHLRFECGKEPKFACPYCGLRSKQSSNLRTHISDKHPAKKIYVVNAEPAQNVDNQPRQTSSDVYKLYSCVDCGRSYKHKGHLVRHLRLGRGRKSSFECPYSDYLSKHASHAKSHIEIIHPTNVNTENLMLSQTLVPDSSGRYGCVKCRKSYKHKGTLSRHIKLECGREPTSGCPYCEYRSKYSSNVMKHIRCKHPSKKVCVVNLALSPNTDDLSENPSSVFYKRYSCADCGKSYKQKGTLSRHLRLECGRGPTSGCPYCGYRSKYLSNVMKHIRGKHPSKKVYTVNLTDSQIVDRPLKKPPCASNIYERYSCANCGRSYKQKSYLVRHLRYECGVTRSFGCPYCDHRSSYASSIKKHIKNIHPKKMTEIRLMTSQSTDKQIQKPYTANKYEQYYCADCGRSYAQKRHLVRHLHLHRGQELSFGCSYYDGRSKRKNDTKKRRIDNLSSDLSERYSCANCGKSYQLRRTLSRHLHYQCNQEPRFSCPYCHYRSKDSSNTKRHVKAMHPAKTIHVIYTENLQNIDNQPKLPFFNSYESYTCADCGKSYKNKGVLSRHLRQECGRKFGCGCPYCDFRSTYTYSIKKHIRRYHPENKIHVNLLPPLNISSLSNKPGTSNIYSCAICRRSYKVKKNLINHLSYECGTVPRFECPYCDYRSDIKKGLKKHIQIKHPAQEIYLVNLPPWQNPKKPDALANKIYKRYRCATCDKSYVLRRDLRNHLRRWCDKVPGFSCLYCIQRSKYASNIRMHIRARHPTKKICVAKLAPSQSADAAYASNVHERYICANCGKSYKRKKNLSNHLLLRCVGAPGFCCPYCGQRSKYLLSLKKHIRRKHLTRKINVDDLAPTRSLRKQPESVSSNSSVRYSCTVCGRSYDHAYDLQLHLLLKCSRESRITWFYK